MKKKLLININYKPTPILLIIIFLIITLGLSPPGYANTRKKEIKGKSNSYRSGTSTQSKSQNRSRVAPSRKPPRSSPPARVEKNNPARRWGNRSPQPDRSNKLKVRTGKFRRHPRKPPPDPPEPIPEPPPKPPKPRPPRKPYPGNGYWCPGGPIGPPTGDENEEYLEPPDSGDTLTPGESSRLAGYEYHISDSFVPDHILIRKIDEYNATHLHSLGLEYPLTARSESLTYQLLESMKLIEHMENKIQYYKQQLEAVRNSNLSPEERSSKELFWLNRLDRLKESKKKEEERVFELRSQIEEEHR